MEAVENEGGERDKTRKVGDKDGEQFQFRMSIATSMDKIIHFIQGRRRGGYNMYTFGTHIDRVLVPPQPLWDKLTDLYTKFQFEPIITLHVSYSPRLVFCSVSGSTIFFSLLPYHQVSF